MKRLESLRHHRFSRVSRPACGMAGVLGALLLMTVSPIAMGQNAPPVGGQTEGTNAPARTRDLAEVGQRFIQLTDAATWHRVRTTPIPFRTYHPQGMTRVGNDVFLSSVEVTEPSRSIDGNAAGTHERTPGAGKAHLFRISAEGERTGAVELSEGTMYHPGGIDYDGRAVWVPVAEYRPHSRSIIYRVDPETMEATAVFRVNDHIGAVVYDAANERLHGMNWDARQFYTWDLSAEVQDRPGGRAPRDQQARAPSRIVSNSSFYIAYQDCQFVAEHHALCGGLQGYSMPGGRGEMTLGGLELIDLDAGVPVWQLPLPLYAAPGIPMTRNPFYAAPNADGSLRFYFAPEDDTSSIYVYDAIPR